MNRPAPAADLDEPVAPPDLRLVPAALAVWAGCLLGMFAGAGVWWAVGSGLLCCAGGAARRPGWRPGLAVVAAFLSVGAAHAALLVAQADADPALQAAGRGAWVTVDVSVAGFAEELRSAFGPSGGDGTDDAGLRYRIAGRVERLTLAGRTTTSTAAVSMIGVGPAWADLVPGQHVSASGRLSVDDFPAIAGARLTARTGPIAVTAAPLPYRVAAQVRQDLRRNAGVLRDEPAGLLSGLVLGDTSGIDDRLDADAKATGLTHLLAVSGSHVVLLCGLAVITLGRWGPRAGVSGGAVMLAALVIVVGPQPSVLRASVMGLIGLLGVLSGRPRVALPALAAATMALLLADPTLAASFGFGLSVLATAGLVLLAPGWSRALRRRGVPRGPADLLVIPVAAQVTTLPVIVALSGQVSPAALPANLAVALVVPPALVLGFLATVVGPLLPGAAQALIRADGPLLSWITGVAHTLARQPGATLAWPATPGGIAGLIGALAIVLFAARHRRGRAVLLAAGSGAALILVPVGLVGVPGWPPPGWLLVGCAVGQGDALVLSTGVVGSAVVIDTGPDPPRVDTCLDRLGITSIPVLVLSHLHADHIDGLAGVLDGRAVGAVAVGPQREPLAAWQAIHRTAATYGVPVVDLPAGTDLSVAGLALSALAPSKAFHGTESDANNDSVVLLAERSGVRMLLTGDIELPAQQSLLRSGADLSADVLKVPHHGSSKLDQRLVSEIGAGVAVIGVGIDNDYGHPSPRALATLAAAGVRSVLRTDIDGDVAVCVVDDQLSVATRGASMSG